MVFHKLVTRLYVIPGNDGMTAVVLVNVLILIEM